MLQFTVLPDVFFYHTVLVSSCVFLIHSSVFVVTDPRTVFLIVLVGSFEF